PEQAAAWARVRSRHACDLGRARSHRARGPRAGAQGSRAGSGPRQAVALHRPGVVAVGHRAGDRRRRRLGGVGHGDDHCRHLPGVCRPAGQQGRMTAPRTTLTTQLRAGLGRVRAIGRGLRTNFFWDANSTDNIAVTLQRWALERPADPFLSFEGRRWTVGAFDAEVNRHARAWRALGLAAGDVVALVLENRPAFLFHFYALAKLG